MGKQKKNKRVKVWEKAEEEGNSKMLLSYHYLRDLKQEKFYPYFIQSVREKAQCMQTAGLICTYDWNV